MGNNSRGMALVIVIFILSLMTITAVWLVDVMMISVRRTENIRDSEQAHQIAVASEMWGVSVLELDGSESTTDHPAEAWSNLGAGVAMEEGTIETVIIDQQGLLNINNLLTEARLDSSPQKSKALPSVWIPAFKRLLRLLEIDESLADAVIDWMDEDQEVRGIYGAEDHAYLGKEPPYRAANRMFNDISELIWVKGFDEKIINKLSPFMTALPATDVRININTAPLLVMRIIGTSTLSEQEAKTLIDDRPLKEGYTIDAFLKHDRMAGQSEVATRLSGDNSRYFNIVSTVQYGRANYRMISLVNRVGKLTTVVLRR